MEEVTHTGSPMVMAMLFAWIPAVIFIFAVLPNRRAVITSFVLAWLFLPIAGYTFKGFPDYNKVSATCFGVFLATLIFDINRLTRFRFKLIDIPILIFCICPIASSLTNDQTLYDGLSSSFAFVIRWGMPYFIGRLYFNDLDGLKELAIGVFIGGLLYVPLCLFEVRMSPQLHDMVYGYHQHSFLQTKRGGGFRPTVFMSHGLMVGMWMAMTSIIGVNLWQKKTLTRIFGVPMAVLVSALVVTTVLCKSTGAVILMVIGITIQYLTRFRLAHIATISLSIMIVLYLSLRITGLWDGEQLVSLSSSTVSEARGSSLGYRIRMETILADHAMKSPVFGWSGWGRNRPADVKTITDSQWIIILGIHGLVGLTAFISMVLLPVILLYKRVSPAYWNHPSIAPIACCSIVVLMYMADNLFNAMYNPIYLLMIGGLAGLNPVRLVQRQPKMQQEELPNESRVNI